MIGRCLAFLVLVTHLALFVPSAGCAADERGAGSEVTCPDEVVGAQTGQTSIDLPADCLACHLPACHSMTSCALSSMTLTGIHTASALQHVEKSRPADLPAWASGDVTPPLPPPPRT